MQFIEDFSLFIRQCLKCRKNTVVRMENRRTMLLSKYEVFDSRKSIFIKEQEVSGLLSSLGTKIPLSKILFHRY